MAGKGGRYLVALVQTQQTVIYKNAGELIANRTVQQRSYHRGIDAAGQR